VLSRATRRLATARGWLERGGDGDLDGVVAKRLGAHRLTALALRFLNLHRRGRLLSEPGADDYGIA
jgi:hypothetical protein